MILPNIVWKAGRTAGAVRMSAVASLVLVLQSDLVKEIKLDHNTLNNLYKQMISTLDDENKSTRLYVCKIFLLILKNYGDQFDKDQLHKLYPELIKRLDDQVEEIRHEILSVFSIYIDCLNKNYDNVLYQAHLQVIYENLLLYLDDSSLDIQLKVFGKLNIYIIKFKKT
jgi:dynein assembly factor 5